MSKFQLLEISCCGSILSDVLEMNQIFLINNDNYLICSKSHFPYKRKVVLLGREISLKVTNEKVQFSVCDFCNNFRDYIYYSKTYLMMFKPRVEGINTA